MNPCLAEPSVGQTVFQPTLEMEAELLRIANGRERENGGDATAPLRIRSRRRRPLDCSELVSRIRDPFAASPVLAGRLTAMQR